MKKLTFVGIDTWNRPIFKDENKNYYGSVDCLFSFEATDSEVKERLNKESLCYFGRHFGCEPMGTSIDTNKIELIY